MTAPPPWRSAGRPYQQPSHQPAAICQPSPAIIHLRPSHQRPSHHPSAAQPSAAQPSTAQPSTAQPALDQPSAAQPALAQPSVAQPPAAQLPAAQPSAISSPASKPHSCHRRPRIHKNVRKSEPNFQNLYFCVIFSIFYCSSEVIYLIRYLT